MGRYGFVNILLVHCHYRLPGGEDAVFAAEAQLLRARGHSVFTYELSNPAADAPLADKLLLPLRTLYDPAAVRAVRALIRQHAIDLVHVHNTLLVMSPAVLRAAVRTAPAMVGCAPCGTAATAAAPPRARWWRRSIRSTALPTAVPTSSP